MLKKKPNINPKKLGLACGFVILTSFIVGFSVWYYMGQKALISKKAAEKHVHDLQTQLEDLKRSSVIEQSTAAQSGVLVDVPPVAKGVVTSEANGWKQYTNKSLNFSFKFPSTWTLTKDALYSDSSVMSTSQDYVGLTSGGSNFFLFINVGGFGAECSYPIVSYGASFVGSRMVLGKRTLVDEPREEFQTCGYIIDAATKKQNTNYLLLASGPEENLATDEKTFQSIANSLTLY